jgi:hypothetical protein
MKSLRQDEEIRKREAEWQERNRPKREAEETKKKDMFRWQAYFLDHFIIKSLNHNGYCIHCQNEFKTPNEGRKLFIPCPRCSKEAVTWRAVEKPEGHMPMWLYDSIYKSLDTP